MKEYNTGNVAARLQTSKSINVIFYIFDFHQDLTCANDSYTRVHARTHTHTNTHTHTPTHTHTYTSANLKLCYLMYICILNENFWEKTIYRFKDLLSNGVIPVACPHGI